MITDPVNNKHDSTWRARPWPVPARVLARARAQESARVARGVCDVVNYTAAARLRWPAESATPAFGLRIATSSSREGDNAR